MNWHRFFCGILTVAVAACFCSGSLVEAKTIKVASVLHAKHPVNLGIQKFKDIVEKESNGKIQVKVYPAAQLGNIHALTAAVKLGDIQGAVLTYPAMGDMVKAFNILAAGYLFRDFDHQNAVINSELGATWRHALIKKGGLRIIGSLYFGYRTLTTTKKPIYSPKDLHGLKIRSVPNPMSQAVVSGLGGTPTPVPFPELFGALRQGVVDGQENPFTVIWNKKLYQVQKYLMLTRHQLISLPFVMNNDFYQGLSEDLKNIVLSAAVEGTAYGTGLGIELENAQLEKLKEKGIVVIGEQEGLKLAAFRESVMKSVKQKFAPQLSEELFDKVHHFQ